MTTGRCPSCGEKNRPLMDAMGGMCASCTLNAGHVPGTDDMWQRLADAFRQFSGASSDMYFKTTISSDSFRFREEDLFRKEYQYDPYPHGTVPSDRVLFDDMVLDARPRERPPPPPVVDSEPRTPEQNRIRELEAQVAAMSSAIAEASGDIRDLINERARMQEDAQQRLQALTSERRTSGMLRRQVDELRRDLDMERRKKAAPAAIDQQLVKDAIKLCHPDRHHATALEPLAGVVTGKLLDLREKK